MIGYTTIGVKDIEASKKFYTELFDAEVLVDAGRLAMIGTDIAQPKVAVCEPFDGNAPSCGNGSMTLSLAGLMKVLMRFIIKLSRSARHATANQAFVSQICSTAHMLEMLTETSFVSSTSSRPKA